jgi:hypothetical protein
MEGGGVRRKSSLFPVALQIAIITFVGWIVFAIFYAGLFLFPSERDFANKLISYKSDLSKTVYIKELTNFDWDQVCLILPYEDIFQESFKDAELRMLRPALQYRFWVGSEGSWWLVFKLKQAVVKSVRIKSIYMPIYTGKYRSSKTSMKTYSCLDRDAAFLKFNDLHNAIISFGRQK